MLFRGSIVFHTPRILIGIDKSLRRLGQLLTASALFVGTASAQIYSDPVGYLFYSIPGNSETLIPLQLAKGISFKEYVTEVTPSGIRFANAIPLGAFGDVGRAYMEVRIGIMAGLSIPATGFSGNFLNLDRSPVGLVSPGDFASIREEQTLGELFDEYHPFQTGTSAELADNVSIWDARTQTSRVFYSHTGLGWRESGKADEGDKSSTPVLFPSGVIVRRRAATPARLLVQGQVILPMEQRYHPVWPGRNIISAPITTSPTLGHYIRPLLDAPHTVISAASAPLSDTLRFYENESTAGSSTSISPVIYFSSGQWRLVGSNEDAGATTMGLFPCIDLQRVGPAGYIRFEGVPSVDSSPAPKFAATAAPVTEVRPVTMSKCAAGLTVQWPAEAGKTYQVQTRSIGATSWTNLQGPQPATSGTGSIDFRPETSACVRVIQL